MPFLTQTPTNLEVSPLLVTGILANQHPFILAPADPRDAVAHRISSKRGHPDDPRYEDEWMLLPSGGTGCDIEWMELTGRPPSTIYHVDIPSRRHASHFPSCCSSYAHCYCRSYSTFGCSCSCAYYYCSSSSARC